MNKRSKPDGGGMLEHSRKKNMSKDSKWKEARASTFVSAPRVGYSSLSDRWKARPLTPAIGCQPRILTGEDSRAQFIHLAHGS